MILKTPSKSFQGAEGISSLLKKLNIIQAINCNEAVTLDTTLNQEEGLIREKFTRRNIIQAVRQANLVQKNVKRARYNIARSNSQTHSLARSSEITKEVLRGFKAPNIITALQPEQSAKEYNKSVKCTTRSYRESVVAILKKSKVDHDKKFLSLVYDRSKKQARKISLKFAKNPPYLITSSIIRNRSPTLTNDKKLPTAIKSKVNSIKKGSLLWNSIDPKSIKRAIDESPRTKNRYNDVGNDQKKAFSRMPMQKPNLELHVNYLLNEALLINNSNPKLFATSTYSNSSLINPSGFKNRGGKIVGNNSEVRKVSDEEEVDINYLKQELHLQTNEPIVLLPTLKIGEELKPIRMIVDSIKWIDPVVIQ